MEINQALIEDPPKLPVGYKRDGTPQKRANQWTKRREEIDVERLREQIKISQLLARAHRIALGKETASSEEMQALKVLLDKRIPTLQAVEQTYREPAIERSESELLSQLRAVIVAHPGLVQQVLGEQARSVATELHDAEQQKDESAA